MLDVTIVVSTFGDSKWQELAHKRALPCAGTFGVPVIYSHRDSLHEARNTGLYAVKTEFVCHLDADDELSPDYFEQMEKVNGDLRPPSVNHVYANQTFMPKVVGRTVHQHECVADCLVEGNWLVVGTVARTKLLQDIGGWKEWLTFEDFDLWQRAWLAGATITPVPEAIYKAYSTPAGRCKNLPFKQSRRVQYDICKTNMPDKDFGWLLK